MATQDTIRELHSQVEEAKENLVQAQTDNLVAREDAKRFVVGKITLYSSINLVYILLIQEHVSTEYQCNIACSWYR